jgi:hypothetical protein
MALLKWTFPRSGDDPLIGHVGDLLLAAGLGEVILAPGGGWIDAYLNSVQQSSVDVAVVPEFVFDRATNNRTPLLGDIFRRTENRSVVDTDYVARLPNFGVKWAPEALTEYAVKAAERYEVAADPYATDPVLRDQEYLFQHYRYGIATWIEQAQLLSLPEVRISFPLDMLLRDDSRELSIKRCLAFPSAFADLYWPS